jgi:cell division septal protein FtsQ
VQSINVVGTTVTEPLDISEFTLNTLGGRYVWLLPKSSIFLVHNESIAESIKGAFPRLKSVIVDRDGLSSLRVTVTEYPGVYLWCDDACSFMDENGTVFADAPYFSGSAYLKIYSGVRAPYPFTPITQEELTLVAHLKDRLEAIDIVPLSMRFESDRKLSVSFNHYTHVALLYFDQTEDIDRALATLYSGLRTDSVAQKYHDPNKVLEYLDMRFVNKLIHKFQ